MEEEEKMKRRRFSHWHKLQNAQLSNRIITVDHLHQMPLPLLNNNDDDKRGRQKPMKTQTFRQKKKQNVNA